MNTRRQGKTTIFRPADFFFLLLSIGVASYSVMQAAEKQEGKPLVFIESPEGQWVYELDADAEAVIPGTLGDSRIEIRGGHIRFIDSPCDNKVCVAHSPLTGAGDWSACLPNQVFVRIEGTSDGIDIIAN